MMPWLGQKVYRAKSKPFFPKAMIYDLLVSHKKKSNVLLYTYIDTLSAII